MANTTFKGTVRAESGLKVSTQSSTLGTYSDKFSVASTGIVTGKFVNHIGVVTGVTCNTTAGDSDSIGEFSQPANTIITNCYILCTTAPVVGTGDIGYEVGTSSSGAQIIAAQTDEILDGGTTVVLGSITYPGLAASAATNGLVAITQDGTTHAISAQYTASARTLYCNITNTTDATTQGAFTFVFEYIQFS